MTQQATQENRFGVLSIDDQGRCATFELLDEDHTLGNSLRHMILKNPDVKFCGYASPHPNERKIHFQIQMFKGTPLDAFEKGLKNLVELNSHVKATLQKAHELYGDVPLECSSEEE